MNWMALNIWNFRLRSQKMHRYIKRAAVVCPRVVTGKNHAQCFIDCKRYLEHGFIDDEGIFLDRKVALLVAEEAGQVKFKCSPGDVLISEDMEWDDDKKEFKHD